jgi:ubiquinone/menaquinone biosynthesis C-methylase UbiE
MTAGSVTCFDRRGTFAEVRVRSEESPATRTRAIWMAGDLLPIARSYATGAEEYIKRLGVSRGDTVLDVACGTGNLAIPAARTGARVYGIDIASYVIAQARLEARAAGCKVDFDVGNAESMAFMDGMFDATVTMFGAIFSARPAATAAELVRVTRSGGRVAMANLTPVGFAGHYVRAHAAVLPPSPGAPNLLDWGQEDKVRALFGDFVSSLTFARRSIELRFPMPPSAVSKLFVTCYGPTVTALEKLRPGDARDLRNEISRLVHLHNVATDGTTAVPVEFLDVQARVA